MIDADSGAGTAPQDSLRHVRLLLMGLALLLGLTAAFTRLVDPFWYFRDVEIDGFNAIKTKFRRFERHVKPAVFAAEQPEAVVLGGSFAEIGFDPLHPVLTRSGQAKSYNFALAGTPWNMNFCALEYVLATAPLKRIVLGIHAQPLPAFDCTESIADMRETSWTALLLSPRALGAAIETVAHQGRTERGSHTREGMYFYSRHDPGVDRRFSQFFASVLHDAKDCRWDNLERSRDGTAAPLEVSPDVPFDAQGLARVIDSVSGRDVTLRLAVYPRHVLSIEADYLCGRQMERWRALWQLAHFLETHPPAPPASVEIWDFQGYSTYTTEPVTSTLMNYWQDPEHFNYEFGNVMLEWMFGAVPDATTTVDGLGYRVTTATLARRYAWFSRQRVAFLAAHAATWTELARLLPPALVSANRGE
ncbi:MAG: hypothetical protein ABW205_02010 [Burkholderiales bacterium]